MSEVLLQNRGKFNFYDDMKCRFRFDAAITLQEVQDVVKRDAGEQGLLDLPRRVKRSKDFARLRDLLQTNRAGEGGKHLTIDECLEFYLS